MTTDIRARARDAVRVEIAEHAYDLFAAQGFDNVTVDQVASETGISRATFFRYFSSKEDAVVVAVESSRRDFSQDLRTLTPAEGETTWSLLRRMLEESVRNIDAAQDRARSRAAMVLSTPSLRSRLATRRAAQVDDVVQALEELGIEPPAARVTATAAFATYDVAWRTWATTPELAFREILDSYFEALARETGNLR